MKKNEYMAPEVEVVELTEQGCVLTTASQTGQGGELGSGTPPPPPVQGGSRRSIFDDEE